MENRIRDLRKKHHMSQIRLSIELGVSQETISAYESGKHYPSYPSLVKLSEIFGVSIDFLMGLSEEKNTTKTYSSKEIMLLDIFNELSDSEQQLVFAYMQGLADSTKKE